MTSHDDDLDDEDLVEPVDVDEEPEFETDEDDVDDEDLYAEPDDQEPDDQEPDDDEVADEEVADEELDDEELSDKEPDDREPDDEEPGDAEHAELPAIHLPLADPNEAPDGLPGQGTHVAPVPTTRRTVRGTTRLSPKSGSPTRSTPRRTDSLRRTEPPASAQILRMTVTTLPSIAASLPGIGSNAGLCGISQT